MIPAHDSSKSENKYFTDNIPIMDGGAFVHKTPRSGGIWQFRMWIKEEGRHVRKTLKTRDLDEALELGRQTYAQILGQTASGKKLFGTNFTDACQQWLETQQKRVDTGRIVPTRLKTISTQINRHVIPYIEQQIGKKAKIGSLSYNSFYDFAQFRRIRNPEVQEVTIRNEPCLSGCHPYPLHLGCSQSPE